MLCRMKTRNPDRAVSASRSIAAGLLARLMEGSLRAGRPLGPRRRGWRRELAASLEPAAGAAAERVEWVGSRESGVVAVPRDG